jgi:hypothetical protein
VLTPHVGYVSRQSYAAMYGQSVEDVVAWLDDATPRLLTVSGPSGFAHFMQDLMEVLSAGQDRASPEVAAVREKYGWIPA